MTDIFNNATTVSMAVDSFPPSSPPPPPPPVPPFLLPYPEVDHVVGVDQVVGVPHRGASRGMHGLGRIEAVGLREGGREGGREVGHESESVLISRSEERRGGEGGRQKTLGNLSFPPSLPPLPSLPSPPPYLHQIVVPAVRHQAQRFVLVEVMHTLDRGTPKHVTNIPAPLLLPHRPPCPLAAAASSYSSFIFC